MLVRLADQCIATLRGWYAYVDFLLNRCAAAGVYQCLPARRGEAGFEELCAWLGKR